jgi:integrase
MRSAGYPSDRATPQATRGAAFRPSVSAKALAERGLSERSARRYGLALARLEENLVEGGHTLADCSGADLVLAAGMLPGRPTLARELPLALRHAWELLGRRGEPPALRLGTARPKARRASSSKPARSSIEAESLAALGLSPGTVYIYERILARVEGTLAEIGSDLERVTAPELRAVAADFPRSHARLTQLRGALRAAWEVLGRRDPPLWAIRPPKKPRMRCRALTEGQARALEAAAAARGDRVGLAVLIGLYAALRREEIASLRWEDFSPGEDGTPLGWVTVTGKGDVTAPVPIHPVLRAELARHAKPSGPLFPGTGRDHVTPATIWEWTKRVAHAAGLPDVTTHQLRHTALTEALDRSHDLRTVQAFARHSKPETTAGYTRVTGRRLVEVASSIDYRGDTDSPGGDVPPPGPGSPAPTPLGLGYLELVLGLEGDALASAWVELAELLAGREAWSLGLDDATLSWRLERHGCWARVERSRTGPGVALFHLVDPGDEETESVAEFWRLDLEHFAEALPGLEASGPEALGPRDGPSWLDADGPGWEEVEEVES